MFVKPTARSPLTLRVDWKTQLNKHKVQELQALKYIVGVRNSELVSCPRGAAGQTEAGSRRADGNSGLGPVATMVNQPQRPTSSSKTTRSKPSPPCLRLVSGPKKGASRVSCLVGAGEQKGVHNITVLHPCGEGVAKMAELRELATRRSSEHAS